MVRLGPIREEACAILEQVSWEEIRIAAEELKAAWDAHLRMCSVDDVATVFNSPELEIWAQRDPQ